MTPRAMALGAALVGAAALPALAAALAAFEGAAQDRGSESEAGEGPPRVPLARSEAPGGTRVEARPVAVAGGRGGADLPACPNDGRAAEEVPGGRSVRARLPSLLRDALPPPLVASILAVAAAAGLGIAAATGAAADLAAPVGLASAWLLLFSAWAASLARLVARLGAPAPLAALAGTAGPAACWLLVFAAGPVVAAAPAAAAAFPWALRLSPPALLGGTIFGADPLRAAPLYGLVPGDGPFAYATIGEAFAAAAGLLAAAALACKAAAALLRRSP